MAKYVGKHRKPPKWTSKKTIASALVTAGVFYIESSASAQPLQENPPEPLKLQVRSSYDTVVIPEPPAEGDGMVELEQWLAAGAPGYIPDERDSKGIKAAVAPSVVEPNVTVVQAVCERGPASALGLSPNASLVYEAICALFPEVTAFGGARWGDAGDHGTGNAIDAMIDPINGDILAQWLIDHAHELPIKYIIWEQRIWQGNGWEGMEDRGSPTQNHYDHVHVSVN